MNPQKLTVKQWLDFLNKPKARTFFESLYPKQAEHAIERYTKAVTVFEEMYGDGLLFIFSSPGRTELAGNHTDHQNGRVLTAAITSDIIMLARPTANNSIAVSSERHDPSSIDISRLQPREREVGRSASLVRGVTAWFKANRYKVGAFDTYTQSEVPPGSGLSSSAAFEVGIAQILNKFFNIGRIKRLNLAKAGRYAENEYFGKPCGLMDQAAVAFGGVLSLDFKDLLEPVIKRLDVELSGLGFTPAVIVSGGSHTDLTNEYAAIPAEMAAVAGEFGKENLRSVPEGDFTAAIPELRYKLGDRAILRAIHFFAENRRVRKAETALEIGNFEIFLEHIKDSGVSSVSFLQNVITGGERQNLTLALALSSRLLDGTGGVTRVHGGGFAGTIQAYVPDSLFEYYAVQMRGVFGDGSVIPLTVRELGSVCVNDLLM